MKKFLYINYLIIFIGAIYWSLTEPYKYQVFKENKKYRLKVIDFKKENAGKKLVGNLFFTFPIYKNVKESQQIKLKIKNGRSFNLESKELFNIVNINDKIDFYVTKTFLYKNSNTKYLTKLEINKIVYKDKTFSPKNIPVYEFKKAIIYTKYDYDYKRIKLQKSRK